MRYYKVVHDGNVSGINTLDTEGVGNITEQEYNSLRQMFIQLPFGKHIKDNSNGNYSYEDTPPMQDSEPLEEDFAQAGRILMGME